MLFEDITIIDENYNPREHTYLLVEGSKIKYIGDTPPENYKGERYGGNNKVLMPGFVNIHCHVPMVLTRGYGEGLPLDRWLKERVFPFEAELGKEEMYWGALLGIAEMISSGATAFTDMYIKLELACKAVNDSGIKANLCNGYISTANSPLGLREVDGNEDTEYVRELMKTVTHDRIVCDMGIHAEYTSNEPLVRDIVDYATENNLRIHLHLSETEKEQQEGKIRRGKTPARYFYDLGVFNRPTTAAHCVWLEGEDFDILGENGVTVAHCPSSNLKLGSGFANIKKMREHGIPVGIGTDGAGSNNNLNVLEEVTLAAMVQKGYNHDPLFLSTADMLKMACKNGALSQGRADTGTIKTGNRADLVVYDLDKPHMVPVVDVLSNVLYSAQASDITMTMIDGRPVYKNGEFLTIDIEKAKFNARRITGEVTAKL